MTEEIFLQLLEARHINYKLRRHAPIFTVAEGEALGLPDIKYAVKSLFITDDKRANFYLVVLPLDKRLDLKSLRALLASRRLTMASAEELQNYLKLAPGAVTPIGLLNDQSKRVQAVFDLSIKEQTLAIPAGSNTVTIWLACQDLVKLLQTYEYQINFLAI